MKHHYHQGGKDNWSPILREKRFEHDICSLDNMWTGECVSWIEGDPESALWFSADGLLVEERKEDAVAKAKEALQLS